MSTRSGWIGQKTRYVVEAQVGPRWAYLSSHFEDQAAFEMQALYAERYPDMITRIVHETTTRTEERQ